MIYGSSIVTKKDDWPSWLFCPACHRGIATDNEGFTVAYFKQAAFSCPFCQTPLDWWSFILSEIKQTSLFDFRVLGSTDTILTAKLEYDKRVHITFTDFGIPQDAKILKVNLSPIGVGYFPILLHSNELPYRYWHNSISLHPVPVGDTERIETQLDIVISWVPYSSHTESWQHLVDAFEYFSNEDYRAMIIPANIAVESFLSQVMTSFLCNFVTSQRTKNFLDNAATYSHQLNVLLPLITAMGNFTKLPQHIRGLLNRLRGLRNDLAHDGKLHTELDRDTAAELLCSAFFGFAYLRLIEKELQEKHQA